ncbi:MAG: alpha/beta hydrolase [Myxococcales bacterium]|nr:alpha/beta hydrolase [Myxococcales bacterium]
MSTRTKQGYALSSVDATPLFYEVAGSETDAIPVVYCDGIGCSGFIWKHLRVPLSEDRKTVHWHYRGHGRSPMPKAPKRVGIEVLSDDLASVLDDINVDEAIVIGHSMGVQVALEFHRRHRYRCKGLVLMCGAASEPLKTFKGSNFLEVALPALQKTIGAAPGLFRRFSRAILPRDFAYRIGAMLEFEEELLSKQDFMPYLKGLAQMDPILFLDLLGDMGEHSCENILSEIRVPTLLIGGQLDTFTPADRTREMAERIHGSELCIVDQGTHSTPLEHPALVGSVTLDFLSRIAPDETP